MTRSLAPVLAGIEQLWAHTRGDPRVVIAMLDGAIERSHRAFAGVQLEELTSIATGGRRDGSAMSHGTRIASILFGQHAGPIHGVAPGVRGVAIPIYASDEEDRIVPSSQMNLARAILQALDAGAHVINISGGQLSSSGVPDEMLAKALERADQQNALVVAAAGNQGCDCLSVPSAVDSVLAVGAMDLYDQRLPMSNWSSKVRGILAPGENIPGAELGGGVSDRTATSYATALVSGVAGLLLSLQVAAGQEPDPRLVREILLDTARPCDPGSEDECDRMMNGRLDVPAALAAVMQRLPGADVMPSAPGEHDPAPGPVAAGVGGPPQPTSPPPSSEERSMSAPVDPQQLSELPPSIATGVDAADVPSVPPPPAEATEPTVPQVIPADCGCGGGPQVQQLIYAIGGLAYDFGTQANLDAYRQAMGPHGNPEDPTELLRFLDSNPWEAEGIHWTLNIDTTPIYVIRPTGPFAGRGYDVLRQFLGDEARGQVERVSVPGRLSGSVQLMQGMTVPVVEPSVGGLFAWTIDDLVVAVLGPRPAVEDGDYAERERGLRNFLDRIYYELRNLGQSDQDRAMNFAATDTYQASEIFQRIVKDDFVLNTIQVVKSPICRPGSDCWDVQLVFFNPKRRLEDAQQVYRYTVDISNVIPVTVGRIRHWSVY